MMQIINNLEIPLVFPLSQKSPHPPLKIKGDGEYLQMYFYYPKSDFFVSVFQSIRLILNDSPFPEYYSLYTSMFGVIKIDF